MKTLIPVVCLLVIGCNARTLDKYAATLTWNPSQRDAFVIDGVRQVDSLGLQEYLQETQRSLKRIVVQFPKGEPIGAEGYSPPYADTALVMFCYSHNIDVDYFGPDGNHLVCHQVTVRNCSSEEMEPDGRIEYEYYMDRQYLGRGEKGIAHIEEMPFEKNSFVQVVVPWKETPQGPGRAIPHAWIELQRCLTARGVRVEFARERILVIREPTPLK